MLFLFEFVAQLKDLDFDLTLPVVLEDALVGLTLPVAEAVDVTAGRVRGGRVARPHLCQVALDVAGGAAAPGRREADVVRHGLFAVWGKRGMRVWLLRRALRVAGSRIMFFPSRLGKKLGR